MLQLHCVMAKETTQYVNSLALLPGAQRLIAGYDDGTIEIWDTETGKQEQTSMKHKQGVIDLVVTRDGTKLVSTGNCDGGGEIKVWNVDSHTLLEKWTRPHTQVTVAISPDDRLIAIGDKRLILRHLDGGQEIKHPIKLKGKVYSMSFSPDGRKLACAISTDAVIRLNKALSRVRGRRTK